MKQKSSWFHLGWCLFVLGLSNTSLQAQPGTDSLVQTLWTDGYLLTLEGQGWSQTKSPYDRLPASVQGKVPEAVWNLGQHSAGLSLRFTTNAQQVKVRWTLLNEDLAMPHMPATGVSGVDLYAKTRDGHWRFVDNGRPTSLTNTVEFDVPPNSVLRLYLPLYNGVTSVEIGIPPSKTLSPANSHSLLAGKPTSEQKPIVFYGTSITQGGCVSRPGLALPSIIGRELDLPVLNLGFSGSAKMEAEMADLINQLDPALFVLDCMWNMNKGMVETRVKPFVRRLRENHPDTPILLVEDSSFENISPTFKGQILRRLHNELISEGVGHLDFLSNEDMLGDDHEGTVDGVHPNDLGMMRQATVFKTKLSSILDSID